MAKSFILLCVYKYVVVGLCIVYRTIYIQIHVSVLLYNIIANQFDSSKKWIGKKNSKIAKICMCVTLYGIVWYCIVLCCAVLFAPNEVNRMSDRGRGKEKRDENEASEYRKQ